MCTDVAAPQFWRPLMLETTRQPIRRPSTANVQNGSVFAAQRTLTAAHRDAAVHEAGIGHEKSFARC